jgi:hypothetical protein
MYGKWYWGCHTEIFIGVPMPDEQTEWYSTDPENPRFTNDIAKVLIETHGDMAHIYALERVVSDKCSEEEVKLWRAVLTLLDKEK